MSLAGLEGIDVTANTGNELGETPESRAADSGAVSSDSGLIAADLAKVVERWPTLPATVRERIMALVQTDQ
jgi:hypothetical protein